jgi:ABC-type uncharacterized transport system substrate-binding protein
LSQEQQMKTPRFHHAARRRGGRLAAAGAGGSSQVVSPFRVATPLVPGERPGFSPVGVDSAAQRRDMEIAVSASGIELIAVDALALDGLEPVIVRLADRGVQALIIPADSLLFGVHRRISAQALDVHLPTIWTYREMVMGGGLASYGVDESESFRRVEYYVHKILNGASPADLPIELPTKFELLINLKTARALGIDVPSQLQLLANEVIE